MLELLRSSPSSSSITIRSSRPPLEKTFAGRRAVVPHLCRKEVAAAWDRLDDPLLAIAEALRHLDQALDQRVVS